MSLFGGGYGTTAYSDRDGDDPTPVALEGRNANLNEMSMKAFRSLLIEHFNKQYHKNKVV